MIILVLGVLLWSGAHLFKRLAPEARARLGEPARAGVAVLVFASIALMWWGYLVADVGPVYWGRTPMLTGLNNLLVLFAVYLFAASGMKTRITRRIRHPQLTAIKAWALGHLLVNGDWPSFVLFGGLLAWAVAEVILINRQQDWTPPPPAPISNEVIAALAAVVVYAAIAVLHGWLGYWPFG